MCIHICICIYTNEPAVGVAMGGCESVSVLVERARERGTDSAYTGSLIVCRPFTLHSTHLWTLRMHENGRLESGEKHI